MGSNLKSIMRIEVPLVVIVGERVMDIQSIRQWVPGSIIELPINAEEELEIRVNNRRIASGSAVKLGENFGIRLTTTLGQTERIDAMGPGGGASADMGEMGGTGEMTPDEIAEAMLAGQL
ncbi:MAG: FliM/FliN family flagellar motor switch protein [Phycisphaerales bacterium]|nr:FliM/FliN family flagellar motor switch protein [Phycisphaerales bacterium]